MTKNDIGDLGSSVCVDDQNEKMIPALGNGSALPGELCAVDPTNGRVIGTKVAGNGNEVFSGILMESKITGPDVAPGADIPCKLVVPKSAHGYRIRIDNPTATLKTGHPVKFGANAGYAVKTTNILDPGVIGRISLEAITGDTVVEVNWK